MPIPLIFLGIGAATAVAGVSKAVKAKLTANQMNETTKKTQTNTGEANKTSNPAQDIVDHTIDMVNAIRKTGCAVIDRFGERKISVLDNSIKPFITVLEKIQNLKLSEAEEPQKFHMDEQSLKQLKKIQEIATALAEEDSEDDLIYGATNALGACGTMAALNSDSIETAITALNKAAVTNATIVFLSGGALKAGTAVLGGFVTGSEFAEDYYIMEYEDERKRNKTCDNITKAEEYRKEMQAVQAACRNIRMRVAMLDRMLMKLDAMFQPCVYALEEIIKTSGTDCSVYTDEEKGVVAEAMLFARAIKAVLDTQILTKDGKLTYRSETVAEEINDMLTKKNR